MDNLKKKLEKIRILKDFHNTIESSLDLHGVKMGSNVSVSLSPSNSKKQSNKPQSSKANNFNKFYNQAIRDMKSHDYEDALRALKKCNKIDPNNINCWGKLGQVYYNIKDFKKAEKWVRRLLQKDNRNASAWYQLGKVYYSRKNYEEAIEYFKKSLDIDKDYSYGWEYLGDCYRLLKNWNEAIKFYKRALELDPELYFSWFHLAYSYSVIGKSNDSIKSYKKALKIREDRPRAWNNLANEYTKIHKYDKALKMIEKALALDPHYYIAIRNRGRIFFKKKLYDNAIDSYKQATAIKPEKIHNWNILAYCYIKVGKLENAFKCLGKALELNREYDGVWNHLGVYYRKRKKYEDAFRCYEHALSLNPKNLSVRYNIGQMYLTTGELEKAYECFKKVIKSNPDYEPALLGIGDIYCKRKEYYKAIQKCKQVLKINKSNISAYLSLGEAYEKIHKFDDALKTYEKVTKISVDHEGAWKKLEALRNKMEQHLEIKRGGDWKIEGDRSVFHFKVKVHNTTKFILTNITILLTSVPQGVNLTQESHKIQFLNPGAFVSPAFQLIATNNCVGDHIKALVTYLDPSGNQKSIKLKPFEIKYVCNLLVPKEITPEEFEKQVPSMKGKSISFACDGTSVEIENMLEQIIQRNNFYLLRQQDKIQDTHVRKLHAFAQGLYDKQDVALTALIQERDEGTKLTLEAMSQFEAKTTDILRDISSKCDDIKDAVELIETYMPLIERGIQDLTIKLNEVESYLINSLGSDFTKVKHLWRQYKNKEIKLGKFLKESIKIMGKALITKAVKGLAKKFLPIL